MPNLPQIPFTSSSSSSSARYIAKDTVTERLKNICCNCGTSVATSWRKDARNPSLLNCNSCSVYYRMRGVPRPREMRKDSVYLKQRKHLKGKSNSTTHSAKQKKSEPHTAILGRLSVKLDSVQLARFSAAAANFLRPFGPFGDVAAPAEGHHSLPTHSMEHVQVPSSKLLEYSFWAFDQLEFLGVTLPSTVPLK